MNINAIRAWVIKNKVVVGAAAVGVVAFVAVLGFLGTIYRSEQADQDDLRGQLAKFREIAARPTRGLKEVRQEFDAVQKGFPTADLTDIDVFRTMQELVSSMRLEASVLQQTGEVPRKRVGNAEYRVLSFSMSISGDPRTVMEMVEAMDQGTTPFKTLVLKTVRVTGGSANLEFDIFTLPAGA